MGAVKDWWVRVIEHEPTAFAEYREQLSQASPEEWTLLVDTYDEFADGSCSW